MDTSEQYYKMCWEAFPEDRDDGKVFKTQDQLQEMVAVKDSTYANIEPFADFAIRQGLKSMPPQFWSMEQLWLAFVMKEKYNKIWDGEKWVESTS